MHSDICKYKRKAYDCNDSFITNIHWMLLQVVLSSIKSKIKNYLEWGKRELRIQVLAYTSSTSINYRRIISYSYII